MAMGRRVVVIGGGMTAIDAAVQSRLLGAEEVTIVYRRGRAEIKASLWEQDLAQTKGVKIMHWAQPLRLLADEKGNVHAIALERTRPDGGRLSGTGEIVTLAADMVFKAIGQTFLPGPLNGGSDQIKLEGGASRSTKSAAPPCPASGPAATASPAAGIYRLGSAGRQARRRVDQPRSFELMA